MRKKIKKHQKISHYSYGRYGSSTTIELENMLKELEHAKEVVVQLKRAELERAEKEENLDTVSKTKQETKSKTINSVDEGDF